jgi:hypothetical protein
MSSLSVIANATDFIYRAVTTAGSNSAGTFINPPAGLAAVGATTGGTLAAATYFYKVTALNAAGQTTGSNEVSVTTTGSTSSVVLTWTAVSGATSYRIYRGTAAGSESVYYTATAATYTDTNASSTSGTVPTTNTSGTSTYTIQLKAPLPTTAAGLPTIIASSAPIFIGGDSNTESVTPTTVAYDQFGNVNITATFLYIHGVGEPVTSASFGLQEAALYMNGRGGGLVALDSRWRGLAGVTTVASMTTALAAWNSVSANVTVLDYGGVPGALSYNNATVGSAYASTGHVIY